MMKKVMVCLALFCFLVLPAFATNYAGLEGIEDKEFVEAGSGRVLMPNVVALPISSTLADYTSISGTEQLLVNAFNFIRFDVNSVYSNWRSRFDIYAEPLSTEINYFKTFTDGWGQNAGFSFCIVGSPSSVSFDVRMHDKEADKVYRAIVEVPCYTPKDVDLGIEVYSNEGFEDVFSGAPVHVDFNEEVLKKQKISYVFDRVNIIVINKETGELVNAYLSTYISFSFEDLLSADNAKAGEYTIYVTWLKGQNKLENWITDTIDFTIID